MVVVWFEVLLSTARCGWLGIECKGGTGEWGAVP